MSIDFEQDKQDLVEKTDVQSLSVQVDKLLDLEEQIKRSEEHSKNLKTMYDKISSEVIHNILAE